VEEDAGGLSEKDKIEKNKFWKKLIAYSHFIPYGQN
jgi:hypothetical protein